MRSILIIVGLLMFVSCESQYANKVTPFNLGDDVVHADGGMKGVVTRIDKETRRDIRVEFKKIGLTEWMDSTDYRKVGAKKMEHLIVHEKLILKIKRLEAEKALNNARLDMEKAEQEAIVAREEGAEKIKEITTKIKQDSEIVRKTISKILNNKATICKKTIDEKRDVCIGNLHFNLGHSGNFTDLEMYESSDILVGKDLIDITAHFNNADKQRITKILQMKILDTIKNEGMVNKKEILKLLGE